MECPLVVDPTLDENKGCDKHAGKRHKSRRDTYDSRTDSRYSRDERRPEGDWQQRSSDGVSTGGLVSAAVGGYAGSKIGKGSGNLAATAGGAVAGYIVGQEIERELTEPDRCTASHRRPRAVESALHTNDAAA